MSNHTENDTDTIGGRIKQSTSGVTGFVKLFVAFCILALAGAAILGPGNGLKAWILLLVLGFSIAS